LEKRIAGMNAAAKVYRTRNSEIGMDRILNVGGFDLDRAMVTDPKFLEPEYPFEWGGVYELAAGGYEFVCQDGPDPAMGAVLLKTASADDAGRLAVEHAAVLAFSGDEREVGPGEGITAGATLHRLHLPEGAEKRFPISVTEAGFYALFTEHHPDEFKAELVGHGGPVRAVAGHEYKPDHEHDEEVSSVGITLAGDLDSKRLNAWLLNLLQTKGTDIFRMKGVLSIQGDKSRFVFQGVHMLFDGKPDRPWKPGEARSNKLIFIGRNLNREELTGGFRACLA
jgi:G3E family GTPase